MTYRELREIMNTKFTEEQLDSDISIYSQDDEYFPATLCFSTKDNDVLDPFHPVICYVGFTVNSPDLIVYSRII